MSPPKRRPLDVLFEDERWVVVDKPAGIPVHGGAGRTGPSVIDRLRESHGAHLHLVHRLDRATAGVLILARDPAHASRLSERWPEVEKHYLAIVRGEPEAPQRFDRPLRDPDGRSKSAVTELRASRSLGADWGASACALRIETGRLHQIRRHLADAQYPVLLDDKYGDFQANRDFVNTVRAAGGPRPKHLLLWCRSLKPPAHPDGPPVLEAPLPRSWRALVALTDLSVDDVHGLT